ncbi:unnamed protein product [Prunus armeniaca]
MEHYFKLEIEKLKKRNGGLNEHDEGHEEVGSPHINEGDDNDMSPLHEYITLITEPTEMEAQVSGDGAKAYAAMQVQEAEIGTSQEAKKLLTPEDVDGCGDWKNSDIKALRGQMNPPIITNVTVAGDEAIKKGSATVEKQDMEGKWGRTKWPTTTLLSPFTDPLRKKRMITISDVDATPPCFDPTNPCPLTMSRQKFADCSAEVQLKACSVGQSFFYKLIDDIEWISSRHLDMIMFLIRKRQLSHHLVFGMDWTTADYCLQPVRPHIKKRVSKKAAAPKTINLPPRYLKKICHFVHDTWQHGYAQPRSKVRKVYFPYNLQGCHWVVVEIDFVRHIATMYVSYIAFTSNSKLVKYLESISATLARVLYDMHFYDASEVEEVKQKGMKMSKFNTFTICSIGDVPQQCDD